MSIINVLIYYSVCGWWDNTHVFYGRKDSRCLFLCRFYQRWGNLF